MPAFQDFLGCTSGRVLKPLITTKDGASPFSLSCSPTLCRRPAARETFPVLGEQRLEHCPTFHYRISNQNRRGGTSTRTALHDHLARERSDGQRSGREKASLCHGKLQAHVGPEKAR